MTAQRAGLRLFVAIYPPAETVAALMKALDSIDLGGVGRVPDQQVHLTLQFVGEAPSRDLSSVVESVERSARGIPSFDLRPLQLATLPERGPPRLVAAMTDAPSPILELQRRLSHRLARNVRDRAGERFAPHLTLQRFKGPASVVAASVSVGAFRVNAVSLMRSILRPAGAEHAEVASIPLGHSAA